MSNNKDPQSGIKVSHQKSDRGRSTDKQVDSAGKFSALINSYID